jgi:hypothetical protein
MGQGSQRNGLILLGALALAGCSAAREPSMPSGVPPMLQVKQLMEWVIDPAADVVWESVQSISTEQGTKEIAPRNDEEWNAVRNAAAQLVEAGSSLTMEGRSRGDRWVRSAQRLTDTAQRALKAAEARDTAAVFASGGEIYNACAGCHRTFAPQLNAHAGTR